MNKNTLRGWAKAQSLGQNSFILRFGVLGWGVPMAIVWSLFTAADEGFVNLPVLLLISLLIFPAGGYVFGRCLWAVLNRRSLSTNSPSPTDN